jgi:Domain of unknown function (DUF305)
VLAGLEGWAMHEPVLGIRLFEIRSMRRLLASPLSMLAAFTLGVLTTQLWAADPGRGSAGGITMTGGEGLASPGARNAQGPHGGAEDPAIAPSTAALRAAYMTMHARLGFFYTGRADIDFARTLIPHQQAAMEMARVVRGFGEDADMKKLAEDILKSSEANALALQAWLKKKNLPEVK